MSFYIVAIATSVASLLLGMGWLFAGKLVLKRWRIEPNDIALLVGRRLGAVYLGTSLLLFLARSAPPSEVRSSLSAGMLVSLALLAALGLFEFKARRAGPGICVSVGVEIILALGFAWVLLANIG
jgi:hypothetical protein